MTLDRGQRDDWFSSPMIVSFCDPSARSRFMVFIPWELTPRKTPSSASTCSSGRNFVISNIFMLLVGMVVFGTTQFIPQLLQQVLGYTATNAGVALTLGGIATHRGDAARPAILTGKVDARYLIGIRADACRASRCGT